MPVDDTTAPEEVERGARLAASAGPGARCSYPLTVAGNVLQIDAATLERLQRWRVVTTRTFVPPQLHKVLGIP
jgi:hypothetical protein